MRILKILTEKEYQKKIEKVKKKNKQIEYRRNIRNEKNRLNNTYKFETSKFIAIYLFALLNIIVVYSMVSMWHFSDLSYLGVLISDIASQVLIYAIYCLKAYKAKKSEEEVKLERDKMNGLFSDVSKDSLNTEDSIPNWV